MWFFKVKSKAYISYITYRAETYIIPLQPFLAAKVGQVMAEHMKKFALEDQRPIPDQGMAFQDFGDDASDSGLEEII